VTMMTNVNQFSECPVLLSCEGRRMKSLCSGCEGDVCCPMEPRQESLAVQSTEREDDAIVRKSVLLKSC